MYVRMLRENHPNRETNQQGKVSCVYMYVCTNACTYVFTVLISKIAIKKSPKVREKEK